MLQELLTLLPDFLAHLRPVIAVAAVAAAAGLWLAGGRFSRAIMTLTLVAAGAWLGLHLPRWMGWSVDGAAFGVCAALILGAAGYLFDRTLAGVALGAVLALWAGIAVWMGLAPVTPPVGQWAWPAFHWTSDPIDLVAQLWRWLPPDLAQAMPLACGCGLAAGIITALLWPRLGRALLFSLVGVSILLLAGLPWASLHRPGWMAVLPGSTAAQVCALVGLVAVGAALQWMLIYLTEGKYAARHANKGQDSDPLELADSKAPELRRTSDSVHPRGKPQLSRPAASKSRGVQDRPHPSAKIEDSAAALSRHGRAVDEPSSPVATDLPSDHPPSRSDATEHGL